MKRMSVNQSVNFCALNVLVHMAQFNSMIREYHKGIFNGDGEDCKDTELQYFRIPAIFSVMHTSLRSCVFHGLWLKVKFWRVKVWQIKGQFTKFTKVLHHQHFPLYGIYYPFSNTTHACNY